MNDFLLIILSATAVLSIYWIIAGQWKHNKMMRQHTANSKPSKAKAIIFDLDGVIIDSLEAWFKVFNETREHYKLPKISKKEFIGSVWGSPMEKDVERYFKGKTIEQISKYYFSNFTNFKEDTRLNPDVKETLEKLKGKKLKLGIVSNSFKKQVSGILEHHKIEHLFDVVLGGDDVENGKPAPDSIFEACKRLKIKPEEAVFVGDTMNDAGASKNAGMFFIGYHTNGDLKISDFKDLLELVQNNHQ